MTEDTLSPADKDVAPTAGTALYAHELRGSLTVIAGYAELLRLPLGQLEIASALDGIDRAIQRANTLCADMLAGREPAAAFSPDRTRIAVLELLECVASEQRAATGREIVVSAAEKAHEVEVLGDREALERVLANLIGNAAKYSLTSAPIDLSLGATATMAVLTVEDRGPGIPVEDRERVFAPFERLDRDVVTPGHGLGLAIVAGVIDAHGGLIEVDDRAGGGAVMRVLLPLAPSAQNPASAGASASDAT